ncbi:MAG: Ig-like domain-containing protein, partial [Candidatus Dormibacteraeota bacterium]|nr:Ig-like domain-containing protein [Candidatus Dormibacteraeota bacterium]
STHQVFTSPINGHTQVATSSAIVVNFPQPMNTAATQQATKITPATEATYHWSDNNRTLTIVPKNDGLAPGQRYQVTFTSAARTESNQPLTASTASPAPITFVTQEPPPPTPTPTPVTSPASPSPTPVPSPLSGVHELGASSGAQPVWSLDGTEVYVIGPGGSLTAYPARGEGPGNPIASSGVTQVVAGPAGPAYLAGSTVSYAGTTTTVAGVTSIGFEVTARGTQLFGVAGTAVSQIGGGGPALTLKATPTAPAAFAPGGFQLVYLAADGLHLVNLATGTDQTVAPATGLGDWAPNGGQYAYVNHGSLSILDSASGAVTGVSGFTGVRAVSWTNNGLLVSTGAGIQELTTPTAAATALTGASDSAASWSPASDLISYIESGHAFVASVDTSSSMAAVSNLITQFMAARQSGNASEAQSLLTGAAAASLGSSSGVYLTTYGAQTLNRWSLILAQPSGVVVVRTVFTQGTQQSVFDEQFRVARSGPHYLIEQASGTPVQTDVNGGPAIQSIHVGPSSLSITFNADLNPATVSQGVVVHDASGAAVAPQSATYSTATRTVTVTVPPLAAGDLYQLQILSGLKDVNGKGATPVEVAFTSSTTQPSAVTNPTPTPSASPSPSSTPSSKPTPTPTR